MKDAVIAAFGVTDADLPGSGWESTIYALGGTQHISKAFLHRLDTVKDALQ